MENTRFFAATCLHGPAAWDTLCASSGGLQAAGDCPKGDTGRCGPANFPASARARRASPVVSILEQRKFHPFGIARTANPCKSRLQTRPRKGVFFTMTQHEGKKKRGGFAGVIEDAVNAGFLPKGGDDALNGAAMDDALDALEMLTDDCDINQGFIISMLLEGLGVHSYSLHEFMFGVLVGERRGKDAALSVQGGAEGR